MKKKSKKVKKREEEKLKEKRRKNQFESLSILSINFIYQIYIN